MNKIICLISVFLLVGCNTALKEDKMLKHYEESKKIEAVYEAKHEETNDEKLKEIAIDENVQDEVKIDESNNQNENDIASTNDIQEDTDGKENNEQEVVESESKQPAIEEDNEEVFNEVEIQDEEVKENDKTPVKEEEAKPHVHQSFKNDFMVYQNESEAYYDENLWFDSYDEADEYALYFDGLNHDITSCQWSVKQCDCGKVTLIFFNIQYRKE